MNEYVTTKQASKMFGYTSQHIAYLIRTKKIVGHRFGPAWMVCTKSMEQYVEMTQHMNDDRYGPRGTISFVKISCCSKIR